MPTHNSWQPRTNCRMCAGSSVIEEAVERNSWGKSGCEWMCCFPNTGGLHHTSGDAPLETHTLAHNTSLQPRTNCRMCAGRSVLEHSFKHNSLGNSGCEKQMCTYYLTLIKTQNTIVGMIQLQPHIKAMTTNNASPTADTTHTSQRQYFYRCALTLCPRKWHSENSG